MISSPVSSTTFEYVCLAGHICNCGTPSCSMGNCVASSWSVLINIAFSLCYVQLFHNVMVVAWLSAL